MAQTQTGTETMAKQLMIAAIYGDDRALLRATEFICDRTEGKVTREQASDYSGMGKKTPKREGLQSRLIAL